MLEKCGVDFSNRLLPKVFLGPLLERLAYAVLPWILIGAVLAAAPLIRYPTKELGQAMVRFIIVGVGGIIFARNHDNRKSFLRFSLRFLIGAGLNFVAYYPLAMGLLPLESLLDFTTGFIASGAFARPLLLSYFLHALGDAADYAWKKFRISTLSSFGFWFVHWGVNKIWRRKLGMAMSTDVMSPPENEMEREKLMRLTHRLNDKFGNWEQGKALRLYENKVSHFTEFFLGLSADKSSTSELRKTAESLRPVSFCILVWISNR